MARSQTATRTEGTAVAIRPMDRFKQELALQRDMFGSALPQHVPVEKFQANLIAACAMTPKLLECNRPSLLKAAMTAAQLGLMVDPVLGHAYLVPYGDTVQCIPGYKGFIHLARQSGEIASLYAHEVYANDEFEIELGTNKRLVHKPRLSGDRGDMVGVYAAWSYSKAVDQGGKLATDFEFMTTEDIEAIRTRSKAGNNGPWKTDYIQMARKTVIRRAAKYLPLSVQRAAILDAAYEDGKTASVADGQVIIDAEDITSPPPATSGRQLDGLEQRVSGGTQAKRPDPIVIQVPQTANGFDWKQWADAAIAAIAGVTDAAWLDRWEALNKTALNNCEFNAPEQAERVVEAMKAARS